MTNGDRIRQMTDEELADFIYKIDDEEVCDEQVYETCHADKCTTCILAWLKQEAKE